jgi:hypothetical protein
MLNKFLGRKKSSETLTLNIKLHSLLLSESISTASKGLLGQTMDNMTLPPLQISSREFAQIHKLQLAHCDGNARFGI